MTPTPERAKTGLSWLWLGYPFLVFLGLQFMEPRYLALLLGVGLLLKWRHGAPVLLAQFSHLQKSVGAVLILWIFLTGISNDESLLRSYPAIISLSLLILFSITLKTPPSMIEMIARLKDPQLPDAAIPYTRKITWIWCVFFAINATIAIYSALYTSREFWALYNGLIAYLLMGMLFAGEWLWRHHVLHKDS